MRKLLLAFGTLGLACLVPASPLGAQVVRGRVLDSLSRAPLGASFVVLLDARGVEVDRALTTSTGTFRLEARAPGAHRLRSERIGYRLAVSSPIAVPASGTVSYTFHITPVPLVLSAVEVRAEQECALNPDQAQATLQVWEEIQKALAATAWDGTQELARYRNYNYERDLSANRRRVTREAGKVVEGVADQPYVSLPAEWLAREGYVVSIGDDELEYTLPDANVLLDDAFLSTHCFHVVRDAHNKPGQIGLAFAPVEGHDAPDIRGALWLDEATSELRTLEASYTRLPTGLEDDRAGGTVAFLRLPSGAWIVQRWELRTPMVRMRRQSVGLRDRGRLPEATVVGWRDFGGEVLEVNTADGTIYPANLGHVAGTVFDSTRRGPLAGATVALGGTGFSTVTDSAGAFHIAVPLEGEYAVALSHPWLDSIAYRLDRTVELTRGSTQSVALAVPHARSWLARLCPDAPDSIETGALVGVVRGSDGVTPVGDVRVTGWWQTIGSRGRAYIGVNWEVTAKTDDAGRFVLCQVPTGRALSIRAADDGDSSRTANLILPTAGGRELLFAWDRRRWQPYTHTFRHALPIFKLDLALGEHRAADVAAPPGGWVSGIVTDETTGQGLDGVRVVLNGRDSTMTRDDGTFDVVDIEFVAGANIVTLRRPGYRPRVRGFALAEGQPGLDLSVSLQPTAYMLEPVEVTAVAMDRYLDEVGFYDRQKAYHGQFLDREYIEERLGRADHVTDLLRGLQGIVVVDPEPGKFGSKLTLGIRQGGSRSCDRPLVWVDGVRLADDGFAGPGGAPGDLWGLGGLVMRPEDVYAIEIYRTPSQIPAAYSSAESGCGVILIWTQRGR